MTLAHVHPGTAPVAGGASAALTVLAALVVLAAAVAYTAGAARLRGRGDGWPRWRDARFAAGCLLLVWAAVGALPDGPFTGHMVRHLLVGMAAPLLLVSARPVTLALRCLSPGRARRALVGLTHTRVVGALVFPPVAAVVDVGGMWLLYRTGLFAAVHGRPLYDGLLHAHLLAAGLLFSFAVCQIDPVRRPRSVALRGGTLLAAGAAHAVLAKTLYAAGPPGVRFAAADLHQGARLMYYGGDVVEAALALVLGAVWLRAADRARRRRSRARECGAARAAGGLTGA
ncbi:cytochrome c oxidase assembly protein [Streptomyces sp. NBC_00704]|uniref:cytochrome c oxidase assembly protein n=1 Tax=Streptomyces sp. NBC_00704 TaxID=2975809 RepID=UPI002E3823AA|nr:cytochrome c oxidase assembly protein [Streptomyces sp. NBC_00704]